MLSNLTRYAVGDLLNIFVLEGSEFSLRLLRRAFWWQLPLRGGSQLLNSWLLRSLPAKFRQSVARRSCNVGSPVLQSACAWQVSGSRVPRRCLCTCSRGLLDDWSDLGAPQGQHIPVKAEWRCNSTPAHLGLAELMSDNTPHEAETLVHGCIKESRRASDAQFFHTGLQPPPPEKKPTTTTTTCYWLINFTMCKGLTRAQVERWIKRTRAVSRTQARPKATRLHANDCGCRLITNHTLADFTLNEGRCAIKHSSCILHWTGRWREHSASIWLEFHLSLHSCIEVKISSRWGASDGGLLSSSYRNLRRKHLLGE